MSDLAQTVVKSQAAANTALQMQKWNSPVCVHTITLQQCSPWPSNSKRNEMDYLDCFCLRGKSYHLESRLKNYFSSFGFFFFLVGKEICITESRSSD